MHSLTGCIRVSRTLRDGKLLLSDCLDEPVLLVLSIAYILSTGCLLSYYQKEPERIYESCSLASSVSLVCVLESETDWVTGPIVWAHSWLHQKWFNNKIISSLTNSYCLSCIKTISLWSPHPPLLTTLFFHRKNCFTSYKQRVFCTGACRCHGGKTKTNSCTHKSFKLCSQIT